MKQPFLNSPVFPVKQVKKLKTGSHCSSGGVVILAIKLSTDAGGYNITTFIHCVDYFPCPVSEDWTALLSDLH